MMARTEAWRCSRVEPRATNAFWQRWIPAPSSGRQPCSPTDNATHRLSPAGWFVWQRLDGEHTLRDLTSEYMATYEASASHAVVEVVVGLVAAGFVEGVKSRGSS